MCDLAEALNIEEVPVEAGDLVSPRYLSPRDLCLVNGIDKMAIQEDATADHGDDKNGHETAEDEDSIKIVHPTSEFNDNGKRRKSVADLKNMFESFSEDPSVEEDLDEKFDLVNGFNKLQNEDLILDQKFDAFFDNVNDNLNEENPLSSFVLKTPSKSQPPLIETESPIKMVLDMITPPPDADMDEEESNVPAAEDKIKPKNKSGKLAKNGKPTTPARKKIGIEKKGDKKTENLKTTVRKCSLTKETPVPKENTNSSKPNTPSKRATGVGYDGRPLLVVKKSSTPNMSSTTTKPIAAPRRNSMPATSKSVPVPSARKVSANNPSNPTTPKRTVSKPTTSTTKPTTASTRASATTSKPTTTTTTKPSIATSKTDKPAAKPTSAATKSTDTKATAKHKGVPFLPKKITSSASSISGRSSTTTTKSVPTTTSAKQPLSKPTTNGTKPTTNGAKPTTNGTKPTTNGAKPTTNGTKPMTNGTNPMTNGAKPTSNCTRPISNSTRPTTNGAKPTTNCTKPTEKIEKSTLKSSNMITITNGRTVGKKASITDDKSQTDSISKHVIRKRIVPKTNGDSTQAKNASQQNKNNYNLARDLVLDIVTKSI